MGHWEDKLYHILEEVNRLGVHKRFDKESERLREEHPHMDTRDLFELALSNVTGNKDNTNE